MFLALSSLKNPSKTDLKHEVITFNLKKKIVSGLSQVIQLFSETSKILLLLIIHSFNDYSLITYCTFILSSLCECKNKSDPY